MLSRFLKINTIFFVFQKNKIFFIVIVHLHLHLHKSNKHYEKIHKTGFGLLLSFFLPLVAAIFLIVFLDLLCL